MKRSDISAGQIVSQASFRDSRSGWPVLILSTRSYRQERSGYLTPAAGDRLVVGKHRMAAVGLLAVHLAFSMNDTDEGPPMDVLDFRIKADRLRELASVDAAIVAIERYTHSSREELYIRDADGEVLGTYELLTGLQMVTGDYIDLTLAERRAQAQRDAYAQEAEQQRQAAVVRARVQLARLAELGITGYHVSDWDSPSRAEALSFEHMDRLLALAESAVRANRAAGIGG